MRRAPNVCARVTAAARAARSTQVAGGSPWLLLRCEPTVMSDERYEGPGVSGQVVQACTPKLTRGVAALRAGSCHCSAGGTITIGTHSATCSSSNCGTEAQCKALVTDRGGTWAIPCAGTWKGSCNSGSADDAADDTKACTCTVHTSGSGCSGEGRD